MTGEDLGYKPGVVEQAKFQYSLLGKVFNKGLDEKDKIEGLSKRLKNIEGKNEKELKSIKDQGEKQLHTLTSKADKEVDFKNIFFKNKLNPESTKVYNEIKKQNKKIDYTKLFCVNSGKQHHYNFTIFLGLVTFAEDIYDVNLSLKAAKIKQRNMEDMIRKLEDYNPNKEK